MRTDVGPSIWIRSHAQAVVNNATGDVAETTIIGTKRTFNS
mgnify:CR=1 FL=1